MSKKENRTELHTRTLGVEVGTDILWFWIGTHADYDKLVSSEE